MANQNFMDGPPALADYFNIHSIAAIFDTAVAAGRAVRRPRPCQPSVRRLCSAYAWRPAIQKEKKVGRES